MKHDTYSPTLCEPAPPRYIAIPQAGSGGGSGPGGSQAGQIVVPWENRLRSNLAVYAVGSGAAGPITVYAFAHNPSPRLRMSISVGWELANNAAFARGAGAPTWSMTAIRRSAQGGMAADLNAIFASRSLPDAYEVDSNVEDVRMVVTLNNTDLATLLAGNLVIEGLWKPNGPIDDQVALLLKQGGLQVIAPIQTIQNTS